MEINQFRSPLVMAAGVFLGFTMNFATAWMPNSFTNHIFRDTVISIGLISSSTLLVSALYRILKVDYGVEKEEQYYRKTLRLFITGICIPFVGVIIIIIESDQKPDLKINVTD